MFLYLSLAVNAQAQLDCSVNGLEEVRTHRYKELMAQGSYKEAADTLLTYLECFDKLVEQVYEKFAAEAPRSTEELSTIKAYLSARHDIAMAFLGADQTNKCLEIAVVELNAYPNNLLESAEDPQLKAAFERTKELCTRRREALFPPLDVPQCEIRLVGKPVQEEFEQKNIRLPINAVEAAFKAPPGFGMDCIALVSVRFPKGLYSGSCASLKECEASKALFDSEWQTAYSLVGVKSSKGRPSEVFVIHEGPEDMKCGQLSLSLHSNRKGLPVYRLRGTYTPCDWGTASYEMDTFAAVRDGLAEPLDSASMQYH